MFILKLYTFILLAFCAYTDWKERKIYNIVTIPSIFAGAILNYHLYGPDIIGTIALSIGSVGVFGLIFALMYAIGYGDWKLWMAVSAVMNVYYFLALLFVTSLLVLFYVGYRTVFRLDLKPIPHAVFMFFAFCLYEGLWRIIG